MKTPCLLSLGALFASTALLLASTASAGNITYTYDPIGRVTSATYASGTKITYTYDAAGNRTQQCTGTTGCFVGAVAVNDGISTVHNVTDHFDPRANDTGDSLTVTATTNGAHGTTSIDTSHTGVYYVPTTGYVGSDSFTYTITDSHSVTATATVYVTVT